MKVKDKIGGFWPKKKKKSEYAKFSVIFIVNRGENTREGIFTLQYF